jgi:hypothetical protein
MKRLIIFVFLFLIPLFGKDIQKNKNEIGLILINDALFQRDKDYTGAFGISYRFKSAPLKIKYQIDVYTPCKNHINLKEPKPETHPYAGFGYIGAEYKYFYNDWLSTLNIKLGSTGKYSFAREVQDGLHTLIRDRLFQGWDTQIQTRFGYSINPKIQYIKQFENFSLLPYLDIELGNIISQQKIGFKLRSGINYNKNFLYAKAYKRYKLNLYLSYDISNISKNVFLTGFDDYEYAVELVSPVSELILGLDWQHKQFGLTFQNHIKSKEYVGQDDYSKYSTLIFYFVY